MQKDALQYVISTVVKRSGEIPAIACWQAIVFLKEIKITIYICIFDILNKKLHLCGVQSILIFCCLYINPVSIYNLHYLLRLKLYFHLQQLICILNLWLQYIFCRLSIFTPEYSWFLLFSYLSLFFSICSGFVLGLIRLGP